MGDEARLDVDKLHPHMFRHTFCKNLVDAGQTLEKVAMLAGHSSLDTTKIYTVPSYTDLERSVDSIAWSE